MALLRLVVSEVLWYLFSGVLFSDLRELYRFSRSAGADVVFFYKSGMDEQWLGSTAAACAGRLSTAVIVNPRAALPNQTKGPALYHLSQFAIFWLRCQVFVSTATLSRLSTPFFAKFIVNMPHSLVSLHVIYAPGAFDYYNVIFSAGPHHTQEIAALDRAAGHAGRLARPVGYGKMDLLLEQYAKFDRPPETRRQVLLAPSWGQGNILETLGPSLIEGLLAMDFEVVLRPHPMQIHSAVVRSIKQAHVVNPSFRLEDAADSQHSLYSADLIISDYSGVALEYAFLRLRPALFIDVPLKVNNPNWRALGILPIELELRSHLGKVLPADDLANILDAAAELVSAGDQYATRIAAVREEYMYNFGSAGAAACEQLGQLLAQAAR